MLSAVLRGAGGLLPAGSTARPRPGRPALRRYMLTEVCHLVFHLTYSVLRTIDLTLSSISTSMLKDLKTCTENKNCNE